MSFISCPEHMQLHTEKGVQKLKEAVAGVLHLGCILISVTCETQGMNMKRILQELMPLIIKMGVSVAQPEGAPGYTCTEFALSFWSDSFGTCYDRKLIDPEGGVPTTRILFHTNAGKIAIFTTFWQRLPSWAKERLLEAYVERTDRASQTMIVGGSLHSNLLAAENLATRIETSIHFHVNGTLSLFVSTSHPQNVNVSDIHTEIPYAVLTELVCSAEKPAKHILKPAQPLQPSPNTTHV